MKNSPQRDAFRTSEADAWHARNRAFVEDLPARPRRDPALRAFHASELEVGCANGHRLEALRALCGAECVRVEPSAAVVASMRAAHPDNPFRG